MSLLDQFPAINGSGSTLLRVILLSGLIWLAGRSFVESTEPYPYFFRHPAYLAIGAGAALTTITVCLMRACNILSFTGTILVLFAISSIGMWRKFLSGSGKKFDLLRISEYFLIYLISVLGLYFLVPVDNYSQLQNTNIYLENGFSLFLNNDPAVIPQFGAHLITPLPYLGLPIDAVFGLFSYNDHFLYYAFGEYWLNIIIAPTLLFGAYFVSRRLFPWWAALLMALLFCTATLDVKIWSLRGESLAWVVGFTFLEAAFDVLAAIHAKYSVQRLIQPTILLAILYAVTAMTHGVTAFVATSFITGVVLFSIMRSAVLPQLPRLLAILAVFFVVAAATYLGLPHMMSSAESVANVPPPVGTSDPAVEYDKALGYLSADAQIPSVQAAPPYLDPVRLAKATLVVPVLGLLKPGLARLQVDSFAELVFSQLGAVSRFEAWACVLLLGFCLLLHCLPRMRRADPRFRAAFWGGMATYAAVVLLTVYLDYKSVSVFPVAAARRTFVYGGCGYILAVAATLFAVLQPKVVESVSAMQRVLAASASSAPRLLKALGSIFLTVVLFSVLIGIYGDNRPVFAVDLYSRDLARTQTLFRPGRRIERAGFRVASTSSGKQL